MSRRPGIGYPAVEALTSSFNSSLGSLALARLGDVPTALQVGDRPLPLGPYLRQKLRQELFGDHRQPVVAKEKKLEADQAAAYENLSDVFKVALAVHPPGSAERQTANQALGLAERKLREEKAVKRIVRAEQLKYRYSIQRQRKKL